MYKNIIKIISLLSVMFSRILPTVGESSTEPIVVPPVTSAATEPGQKKFTKDAFDHIQKDLERMNSLESPTDQYDNPFIAQPLQLQTCLVDFSKRNPALYDTCLPRLSGFLSEKVIAEIGELTPVPETFELRKQMQITLSSAFYLENLNVEQRVLGALVAVLQERHNSGILKFAPLKGKHNFLIIQKTARRHNMRIVTVKDSSYLFYVRVDGGVWNYISNATSISVNPLEKSVFVTVDVNIYESE